MIKIQLIFSLVLHVKFQLCSDYKEYSGYYAHSILVPLEIKSFSRSLQFLNQPDLSIHQKFKNSQFTPISKWIIVRYPCSFSLQENKLTKLACVVSFVSCHVSSCLAGHNRNLNKPIKLKVNIKWMKATDFPLEIFPEILVL